MFTQGAKEWKLFCFFTQRVGIHFFNVKRQERARNKILVYTDSVLQNIYCFFNFEEYILIIWWKNLIYFQFSNNYNLSFYSDFKLVLVEIFLREGP